MNYWKGLFSQVSSLKNLLPEWVLRVGWAGLTSPMVIPCASGYQAQIGEWIKP